MAHRIVIRRANQQSGELGAAATRQITISGTATLGDIGLELWSNVVKILRQQFKNQGWNIHNFSLEQGSGIISANVDIKITADVSNDFTNEQHKGQALRIFAGYQTNYFVTTNRPFSNIQLKVAGANKPNYVSNTTIHPTIYTVDKGKTKQPKSKPPPSGNPAAAAPPPPPPPAEKGLFDKLADEFQITKQTAYIGVALIAAFVLKRSI